MIFEFYRVEPLLHNPVFEALSSGDAHLNKGNDTIKFFDPAVSPFAGFDTDLKDGFAQLHHLLPAGRKVLFATPDGLAMQPNGWRHLHEIHGVQMVYRAAAPLLPPALQPVPLTDVHVPQMVALAQLTKPGPFGEGTIRFGHYHGFFQNGQLVAMTGQRLHVHGFTEISAVCTHPDHLGKGYASALVQHQTALILAQGQTPFLHVRADNQRAIDVYLRTGFAVERPMIFYVLERG